MIMVTATVPLIERGFDALLPASVATAHRLNDSDVEDILPLEQAIVAGAVQTRRDEFRTGRHCAREALSRLGIPRAPILAGPHQEPLWPPAIVGSITHCDGFRAAAVARQSEICGLGIDVETHGPLPPGVLCEVALPDEQSEVCDLLQRLPMIRWDRMLFSMKESVYKAWFPLHLRWLSFTDCRVRIDPRRETFSAKVLAKSAPAWPLYVHGAWEVDDRFIRTAAWVPAECTDLSACLPQRRNEAGTDGALQLHPLVVGSHEIANHSASHPPASHQIVGPWGGHDPDGDQLETQRYDRPATEQPPRQI
ncbi:4'-phosphopantetheinyl transferase superfamily protein [Auritidibacter ignavus]|uniref:4'-phosphopantetheinyl transferase family protein n=1 Tax=Auritidibacter ignavus TaxID=678932 RepID=UPI003CC5D538